MAGIKHIPLKKLKEIMDNDFTSPSGKCYWDHQDTIRERVYEIENRNLEKGLLERDRQELIQMEEEELYNFKLKDMDIIDWAYNNFIKLTKVGFYGFRNTNGN